MVRMKVTSPVQLQSKPAPHHAPNATVSVQKQTHQKAVEKSSKVALQEAFSIKQQQSLEMVQVMLHVSFGTLFYLREFLPLACFDERDLKEVQLRQQFSYRDFMDGKTRSEKTETHPNNAPGQGKRSQPLKILVRGSDPKVDTILELLEHGIFDALQKHVLEAVQLTVLVDKDIPSNVLESYTFTFKYTGGYNDVDGRLESLSLDPVGCVADMKTVQSARMGLEMIVRRLITLSAFLPALPNKRNLGIHLFYTEDCPPDYEPPGFSMAVDDTVKYPLNDNWRREFQSCGVMDSGCHAVGLNVTSLKWIGPDPDSSEVQPEIPARIEYNDIVPRTEDIGLSHGKHTCNGPRSKQGSFQGETQTTQTQINYDMTARQKLQGMIPTTSPSQESNLIPTQPFDMNAGIYDDDVTRHDATEKVFLSQSKAAEIRQRLHSQSSDFSGYVNGSSQKPIKCQCGWEGEEPAMVECGFCHSRQHLLCYGFRDLNDPRLPDIHSCYRCLLEPRETNLLRQMNTLVLLRRALKIILNEGYQNSVSAFAQKLHCNGHTVVQITDYLRKQGYLQPTSGSHSRGFTKKGLPKFSIPDSEDVRKRMEMDIFDPMAKIQHHYAQRTVGAHTGGSDPMNSQEVEVVNEKDVESEDSHCTKEAHSTEIDIDDRHEGTLGSGDELVELGKNSWPNRKGKVSWDVNDVDHDSGRPPKRTAALPNLANQALSHRTDQLSAIPRKRRKISNYTQLIDVGLATSDEEESTYHGNM